MALIFSQTGSNRLSFWEKIARRTQLHTFPNTINVRLFIWKTPVIRRGRKRVADIEGERKCPTRPNQGETCTFSKIKRLFQCLATCIHIRTIDTDSHTAYEQKGERWHPADKSIIMNSLPDSRNTTCLRVVQCPLPQRSLPTWNRGKFSTLLFYFNSVSFQWNFFHNEDMAPLVGKENKWKEVFI